MPGWGGNRGTRHERGYDSRWVRLRARILLRDGHLCQPCLRVGRPTTAREVDHIIPKSKDGTDESENLQAICTGCHKAKTKAEAADAQGIKGKPSFDACGWPVW